MHCVQAIFGHGVPMECGLREEVPQATGFPRCHMKKHTSLYVQCVLKVMVQNFTHMLVFAASACKRSSKFDPSALSTS